MEIHHLSPDCVVIEYELTPPPVEEEHIELEQLHQLTRPSTIISLETVPLVQNRKELTEEQFNSERDKLLEFIERYDKYIVSNHGIELQSLYYSYCWSRYRDKTKPIFEKKYFTDLLSLWAYSEPEKETQPEEKQHELIGTDESLFHENSSIKEKSGDTEVSYEETQEERTYLHVFDEEQCELKIQLYKEVVLSRYAEHFFQQEGSFPEPQDIINTTKEKLDREEAILRAFFEKGRNEPSLSKRMMKDDFLFHFKDEKFVFFIGKSVYIFTIKDNNFYLGDRKIDLESFFAELTNKTKRIWKHVIRLSRLFERNGIKYSQSSKGDMFFIYHIEESDSLLRLRYNDAEYHLQFDKRNFYRPTGERVIEPLILVQEMLDRDKGKEKARLKAKQFFKTFLSKEEKNDFIKWKMVLLSTNSFNYIICPEIRVNPIIRICKTTNEMEALCVMLDNPYIPRYDVMASSLLLIKSGNEERLNAIANAFELNSIHRTKVKRFIDHKFSHNKNVLLDKLQNAH